MLLWIARMYNGPIKIQNTQLTDIALLLTPRSFDLSASASENAYALAKAFGSIFRRRVAHFRLAGEVPR
jgi:hypothetical protein